MSQLYSELARGTGIQVEFRETVDIIGILKGYSSTFSPTVQTNRLGSYESLCELWTLCDNSVSIIYSILIRTLF